MTHLYDTIEPNVVSEALLRQCVAAQGPEGEAGRIAREEGIDFAEVTRLRLDFQSMCDVIVTHVQVLGDLVLQMEVSSFAYCLQTSFELTTCGSSQG